MDYIEVSISNIGDFDPEIIVAHLAGLGFESFSEQEGTLQGYIPEESYHASEVEAFMQHLKAEQGMRYDIKKIPAQNWNALWESGYEPVTVAGKCRVRAPFHAPDPGMAYDIVIEPKMSFGTAHHETTSLMLELLMLEDMKEKRVLDMGCGTGVLAILAHKMKAAQVVAVDNDEWAFANAPENMAANDAGGVTVIRGDASSIPQPGYDLVVANINRNVLLSDIPVYAGCINPQGILLMSGFYEQDLGLIMEAAEKAGLQYVSHKAVNNWTGAKFIK